MAFILVESFLRVPFVALYYNRRGWGPVFMILVGGRVNPPWTRFDENDDCTGVDGWPGNGQGWTLWLLRCTTMNGRTDTGSGPKPCSRPGRYNCCIIADGLLVSTANSR